MDKIDNGFGLRFEVEYLTVLQGLFIKRLPIRFYMRNKGDLYTKVRTFTGDDYFILHSVFGDLPTTLVVEPTEKEVDFRQYSKTTIRSNRNKCILTHCINPGCNYKRFVNIYQDIFTGLWRVDGAGDLETGCAKCRNLLYSCGRSVAEHQCGYDGYRKCKCVSYFQKLGFKLEIPKNATTY